MLLHALLHSVECVCATCGIHTGCLEMEIENYIHIFNFLEILYLFFISSDDRITAKIYQDILIDLYLFLFFETYEVFFNLTY